MTSYPSTPAVDRPKPIWEGLEQIHKALDDLEGIVGVLRSALAPVMLSRPQQESNGEEAAGGSEIATALCARADRITKLHSEIDDILQSLEL